MKEQAPGTVYISIHDGQPNTKILNGVDNQGFLLPQSIHANPDLTLAFVGGSTTYLEGIKPKERFHYLVGNLLEDKLNKKVTSLNAGIPRADTSHTINTLFNKILQEKPDYVLIMHAINDLNKLLVFKEYWNRAHRPLVAVKYSFGNAMRYFKNKFFPYTFYALSHFFLHNKTWHNLIKETKSQNADEWNKARGKKLEFDEAAIISQFRSAQVTAVKMVEFWGAKPILLIQPNRIQNIFADDRQARNYANTVKRWGISVEQYQNIYKNFLQVVRDIGKEFNIPVVDLDKEIPPTPEYFNDIIHINTKGSKMVAQKIATTLEKEIRFCLDNIKKLNCSGFLDQ
jgi:lysophospholipase L1-like esterase